MVLLEMEFCKVFIFITFSCNSTQSKCYPKAGAREEEAGGGEEEAAGGQEEEGAGGQRKGRGSKVLYHSNFLLLKSMHHGFQKQK
jgi:hypothetical protein